LPAPGTYQLSSLQAVTFYAVSFSEIREKMELEIYMTKDFSQSQTDQADAAAIMNVKSNYGIKRNWQGDPCTPLSDLWDGLNWSYADSSSPRIISLNLSSSGLTGNIAPSISNLKSIEYLDLSNKSLTGAVPDFLSQLHTLRVLNL
ncbi:hypothetical protein PIB30_031400, partial [Stylosanthes scabra]|nr:hypothetical protein [Stylosanthes scabra]